MPRSPIDVLAFGAKPTGSSGDISTNDAAFASALTYCENNGHKSLFVPYMGASYRLSNPLTLYQMGMYSNDLRTTLEWPSDVGSGTYAIALTGDSNQWFEQSYIKSMRIKGGGTFTVGSPPRNGHGIRMGGIGTDLVQTFLEDVFIEGFNYNIVLDGISGHARFFRTMSTKGYYGVYVRRGNSDYKFLDCNLTQNTFASIGCPKDTGLSDTEFSGTHFGYSPYGIYQSNVNDGASGVKVNTFLKDNVFNNSPFEQCGNAAILSEAAITSGLPGFTGNHFTSCFMSFDTSGGVYTIGARSSDWTVDVGYAAYNTVDWGDSPWIYGASGIIRYGGPGIFTMRGREHSSLGARVYLSGDTRYNDIRLNATYNRQVVQASGSSTVTYTYNKEDLAQASGIMPVVTPTANPGSFWWVTTTSTNLTIHTASNAPTAVTWNIAVQI